MGPSARGVLSQVTKHNLENEKFPFGSSQFIEIQGKTILAMRITYVGELGWELHMPRNYAERTYQALMEKGESYGIVNAGYRAIESLRLEKGYRSWSSDITADTTPFEAGLGWAVKLDTGVDFTGRAALLDSQKIPLKKRLVCFTIENPDVVLLGRETIYRNNEIVGWLTSGGWGYTVQKNIGYGYVRNSEGVSENYLISGSYELEIATVRYPRKLHLESLYNPKLDPIKQ